MTHSATPGMFVKGLVIFTFAALVGLVGLGAQAPAPPQAAPAAPQAQAAPARGGGGGGRGGAAATPAPPLTERFDTNADGWLNPTERKAARDSVTGAAGGRGGRGGRGGGQLAPELIGKTAGKGGAITPAEVKTYPNAPIYDESVVRTIFFTFENSDWEKELEDFRDTGVNVQATMLVDGKTYRDVGVRFRGNSSFFRVPTSFKRSLNVSIDMAHSDQNLGGFRTLNLLNSNEDPTLMRAVLYLHVARQYLPAPKANFVRVVINGEYWGVYQNVEQFSKELVKEAFNESNGARWKAEAGLTYPGENRNSYNRYELKSKDDPEQWAALINLCKVLNQTPADQLEQALSPILDIDGALRFLALENSFVSNDGYWLRAADYNLYRDAKGKFHIVPYDTNETFSNSPSRNGQGGDPSLDPLIGLQDNGKPLRSKLFAVPALREKYMGYVRDIATKWMDWTNMGPLVARHQALIDADVKADAKKLYSYEEFLAGTNGPERSLKSFTDKRRPFLLSK